jgi:hypothetical protein
MFYPAETGSVRLFLRIEPIQQLFTAGREMCRAFKFA